MGRTKSKLRLSKETVRRLSEREMHQADGGTRALKGPGTKQYAAGAAPIPTAVTCAATCAPSCAACGSGTFLLQAYQCLLDWYLEQYVADDPELHARQGRLAPTAGGEWRLAGEERKRILLDHIYGVDIDPQAVEVTKLSLLLKVLEERNFPVSELMLVASEKSVGKTIKFKGEDHTVIGLEDAVRVLARMVDVEAVMRVLHGRDPQPPLRELGDQPFHQAGLAGVLAADDLEDLHARILDGGVGGAHTARDGNGAGEAGQLGGEQELAPQDPIDEGRNTRRAAR